MKEKLLIICLLIGFTMNGFAQNLVEDSGFDSGSLIINTEDPEHATKGADGQRGVWYYRSHASTEASIIDVGGERGNVISIERTGSISWYNSYVGQWINATAERDYYKLTFKAKLESGTGKLRTHIKIGGQMQFAILKGGEDIDYSAQFDTELTNDWATYEIEYDFRKVVNSLYPDSEKNPKIITDVTDDQLASFYFAFYPNANNTTILIDDVTLEKISSDPTPVDPDPEPTEGDLIKDGGFDSGILDTAAGNPEENNNGQKGVWYYRSHASTNASIVDAEGERGKVVAIERTGTLSWFNSFVGQWIDGAAARDYYKLTFKAKLEAGTGKLRTHIKTAGEQQFIILKGGEDIDYSGQIDTELTSEWATYEIEYDFSKVVNSLYPDSEKNPKVITDITAAQLASFYVCFYPNANGTTILIDDVSLERVTNDPGPGPGEPEPTEGEMIKDGGFDSGVLISNTEDPEHATLGADGQRGVWYYRTNVNTNASIIDEGGERGNVVSIERTGTISWYNSYIAQWIDGIAAPDFYKLTFKAKLAEGSGRLRMHIKAGGKQQFFILKDGMDLDYSAQKDIDLTSEWVTYTVEYDFTTLVNTLYPDSEKNPKVFMDATNEELTNFYIVFYPNANGTTILIDDVSFERVVEGPTPVEPAPAEGDLLVDTDFEKVTSIPRRTIKNDDKYSPTMGEWYFYAEAGLNGIDESTAEIKEEGGIRGKVAALKNGSVVPSWWGHTLMQRFSARPNANIYRVSFYAKSTANSVVKVMVNTKQATGNTAEFILKEGFDPVAAPRSSGARYDITTSTEWQYYECNFDFTQKCNGYNSPQNTADFAITPTDEEFLSYCYLALFNDTESSEILIDDIRITEIDTYTEILNPGFENDNFVPVKIFSDLTLGAHSGNWVLVSKSLQEGNVSITSDEAYSGNRSMQLEVTELTERARYSFYLAMDIYEVEPKDYVFNFYGKADQADIPFRLDAFVYNGETAQAITGTDGEILTSEGVDNSSAGLKVFQTSTDWVLYSQRMTIPRNTLVRFFIRPNINGLGAAGIPEGSFPITYWFDDFELKEFVDQINENPYRNFKITTDRGTLRISELENATITVYSISGVLMNKSENVTGEANYSLEQGIYVLDIINEQGSIDKIKVLVK